LFTGVRSKGLAQTPGAMRNAGLSGGPGGWVCFRGRRGAKKGRGPPKGGGPRFYPGAAGGPNGIVGQRQQGKPRNAQQVITRRILGRPRGHCSKKNKGPGEGRFDRPRFGGRGFPRAGGLSAVRLRDFSRFLLGRPRGGRGGGGGAQGDLGPIFQFGAKAGRSFRARREGAGRNDGGAAGTRSEPPGTQFRASRRPKVSVGRG